MNIYLSQIFVDRKTKLLKVKREIVAKTEDGILKFPNAKYSQSSDTTQESLDAWTNSKKPARVTSRRHHCKNGANQTCTRMTASNVTPSKGGGRGAYKTAKW